MTITVPFRYLLAAAQFCGSGHSDHRLHSVLVEIGRRDVFMVASDGACLGALRTPIVSSRPVPPQRLMIDAGPLLSDRRTGLGRHDATLRFVLRAGFCFVRFPSVGIVIVCPAWRTEDWPKWRTCAGTDHATVPTRRLSFNSDRMGRFIKASGILCRGRRAGNLVVRPQACRLDDGYQALEVHIDGEPNFYGMLMPFVSHLSPTTPSWVTSES